MYTKHRTNIKLSFNLQTKKNINLIVQTCRQKNH